MRPDPDDVRRIAVLRGGGLGDLVFALPAIEALDAAYPDAEIVLLGSAVHAALLEGRPGPVDRVEVLPAQPGAPGAAGALREFSARLRKERFDLAVQLHGGGRNSNPVLLDLGARRTAGTATEDAPQLDITVPYEYYQHEQIRGLEVVGLLDAPPVALGPRLHVREAERQTGRRLRAELGRPYIVMHPGATDPRRRWPAERFAAVARAVVEDGLAVVLVGDDSDEEAAERIGATVPQHCVSRAGGYELGELLGVLAEAELVVGNDSGPRHLAEAVGSATVGIYWCGNVINAGALTRSRHRVELSWVVACSICGRDVTQVGWTAERCEHDESLVAEVRAEAVLGHVRSLRARIPHPRGR